MYSLLPHATRQAQMKGFDQTDVLAAANTPTITYPNRKYPGQERHIGGRIVAVCDPTRQVVVTVYENVRETAPRADQTDKRAHKYRRKYEARR